MSNTTTLTAEAIDAMEAGPEMNAIVAEEIMRVTLHSRTWLCGYMPDCGDFEASIDGRGPNIPSWYDTPYPVYKIGVCIIPVPDYSKFVHFAFEVVEAMRAKGWEAALHILKDGRCRALFVNDKQGANVEAPTMPLAICKAALKAVISD